MSHHQKTNKNDLRTAARLGVELGAEERLGGVPNALVGTIVVVHKERFPFACQSVVVDSISVVLQK